MQIPNGIISRGLNFYNFVQYPQSTLKYNYSNQHIFTISLYKSWSFSFEEGTYEHWKKACNYGGENRISKDVTNSRVQYGGDKFPQILQTAKLFEQNWGLMLFEQDDVASLLDLKTKIELIP